MFLRELIEHATERFTQVGIESAAVDAELLAGHVLGLSRGGVQAQMLIGGKVSADQAKQITDLFGRRLAREPLQHITGSGYFRNLELEVGRGVFIPRPETEFVAQLAIDALAKVESVNPIAVDLGTGSGAIALAMATEVPNARVYAVEKSDDAMPFTSANFKKYGSVNARLIQGDLAEAFEELNGQVAVVASNPPYIPSAAVPRDVEVHLHDPGLALYGGQDGMDVIHQVSATARRLLVTGGVLVIEHADSQSNQVCQLLLADGWREVQAHRDLTDRDRAVTAIK
ncbi:peptide chain release factor N(5)-glutamine methyltransferase [Rhodoluna limnophila]|uniref:peptide chain release factor N(5)-glutamine methyltransferase n=1 Tax=Rhodoluna limnophila TaxID=232537 RepID=UPI0020A5208A|nr:peptide chain release factor N(5)-glutamine methyltransferase [Rhodoluna limnophila]